MAELPDLLEALEIAALAPVSDTVFRPASTIPEELARQFPGLAGERIDLPAEFPFLESFLPEAREFWSSGNARTRRSGPWTQPDEGDNDVDLEAVAVRLPDGSRVLLLERLGRRFGELEDLLQAARERRLAFEQAERMRAQLASSEARLQTALAHLAEANETLEQRVAARTTELLVANRELRSLVEKLTVAEEEERRRIAGCLHDRVGQSLAAAILQLGLLESRVDEAGSRETCARTRSMIDAVVRDVRSLTFELGSPVLYELGLGAALQSIASSYAQDHGLDVRCQIEASADDVSRVTGVTVFQTVRELLHNVTKHADARRVDLEATRVDDQLQVVVADDGQGVPEPDALFRVSSTGGFGLFSVREHLSRLGGRIEVRSNPERGTRVVLRVPLDADPRST